MISEDTLNYGRDYNILNKISKELSVPPFSRHFLLPSIVPALRDLRNLRPELRLGLRFELRQGEANLSHPPAKDNIPVDLPPLHHQVKVQPTMSNPLFKDDGKSPSYLLSLSLSLSLSLYL